jgi:DNA-binding MarR family transcriptional regulator
VTKRSTPVERSALMAALEAELRRASAQGVLFGQVVAERLGMNNSDLECLDIVNLEGPVTAGRLAEATGLTTGAITGVIDRLEKAGYVRRERDVADRRKVLVVVQPEAVARIGALYEPMRQATLASWKDYSDAELALLLRFARSSSEVMIAATAGLRAPAPEKGRARLKTRSD